MCNCVSENIAVKNETVLASDQIQVLDARNKNNTPNIKDRKY